MIPERSHEACLSFFFMEAALILNENFVLLLASQHLFQLEALSSKDQNFLRWFQISISREKQKSRERTSSNEQILSQWSLRVRIDEFIN